MTTSPSGTPRPADERIRAYVYLSAVTERPTAALWDLVEACGPEEAAARIRSGRVSGVLAGQSAARRESVDPEALLAAAGRCGAIFLTPEDDRWPAVPLAGLDLPRSRARGEGRRCPADHALRPLGLWWRGSAEPPDVLGRAVSVVGTRAPTAYGRSVTADLSAGCAAAGLTVVSGAAFGVDAAAHAAALGSGAPTVAVLACGIDTAYPSAHAGLLERIAGCGAVVTEQPPGTSVARYRFLDRNRLIAASDTPVGPDERPCAARRPGRVNDSCSRHRICEGARLTHDLVLNSSPLEARRRNCCVGSWFRTWLARVSQPRKRSALLKLYP